MIELSRHIETLLLENDCVIVPDFGGFVAHYNPATYIEEENIFLPPTRTIGFNSQLKMNDGLLVQSYMAVYGTNFPDATRMVNKEVQNLVACLHENGKVELPNIGEISYTVHGTCNFTPYDNRMTTPGLYGLDSFEIKPLATLHKAEVRNHLHAPSIEARPSRRIRRSSYHWKLKRSYLSNAVAFIAAIALFFMFSTPIENTETIQGNYARLLPTEIFEQLEKQSLAVTPVVTPQSSKVQQKAKQQAKQTAAAKAQTSKEVKPIAVREVKVKTVETKKAPVVAQPTKPVESKPAVAEASPAAKAAKNVKKPYHIIVASVGTEKDARATAEQLKKEGYEGASAIIGNGKMRVSIESFSTQAEAYRSLQVIREQKAYQNAWVLKY